MRCEASAPPSRARPRRRCRRGTGLALGAASGALVAAAAGRAFALCPNCLGQARSLTAQQELIGLFLCVPFLLTWVAFRLIRRFAGPARPAVVIGTAPPPEASRRSR